MEPARDAKIRKFKIVYTQALFLAVCKLLPVAVTVVPTISKCLHGSFIELGQIYSSYNSYIYTLNAHTHTHTSILTLHGNASSNGRETKNAKLPLVKNGKNLAQQKLPDGSETRKGTGTGAAGYRKGKALTPNCRPTIIVPTHMRLQFFLPKLATGR